MIDSERPVLALALVLVFGLIAGSLAKKVRLPSVTGQIAVGVLLGPAVVGLFPHSLPSNFRGLTEFALALISVSAGTHLNFRRLRNAGKRLGFVVGFDAITTASVVFLAAFYIGKVPWPLALILATIAIETSPGTVLSVVNETRSEGTFVKTLVAAVALSDVACIVGFELAHSAGQAALSVEGLPTSQVLLAPVLNLAMAALIGVVIGIGYLVSARHLVGASQQATGALLAVLFAWGMAHLAGVSSILACLFLGVSLANGPRTNRQDTMASFSAFQPAIYAVFFTIAGVHLEFHHLAAAGVLAIVVFIARSLAKVGGVTVALSLAGAPKRMSKNMGMAMLPHASIAVGLMLLIQADPLFESVRDTILAVGLSVVTLSEVLGPIGTRWALSRSGELGQAAPRLLDFLQEADITIGLEAKTKDEAIKQLVEQLVRTHQLNTKSKDLFESVMAREREVSTCLGGGLMIPHAELAEGDSILGVMAISKKPLPFETPDGLPVRCVVLLATPPSERAHHLEVLAALARAIGTNPNVREQLFNSRTAAHAWEVLHQEDSSEFNYFLDQNGKS